MHAGLKYTRNTDAEHTLLRVAIEKFTTYFTSYRKNYIS